MSAQAASVVSFVPKTNGVLAQGCSTACDFQFVPQITAVTPLSVSPSGNAELNITGADMLAREAHEPHER